MVAAGGGSSSFRVVDHYGEGSAPSELQPAWSWSRLEAGRVVEGSAGIRTDTCLGQQREAEMGQMRQVKVSLQYFGSFGAKQEETF